MEGIKKETRRQGIKGVGLYNQGEGQAAGICPACNNWEAELPDYDAENDQYLCREKKCRQRRALVVLQGVSKG